MQSSQLQTGFFAVVCGDIKNSGLGIIDVRSKHLSRFLLQWAVGLCLAQPSGKWSWTPKMLFACLGSRNECFYSNVNSGMFKCLKSVKSHFWQAVLKTWTDNNHINTTSSGCTLLWNNRNVTFQRMFFLLIFSSSKNGLGHE